MATKYEPYPLPPCPDRPEEPTPQPCPDWSICLPFGGRLYSKDGCVFAEKGDPPADGVYGKIIIANGCLVGVEPVEGCLYNIAPCANTASPCGETADVTNPDYSGGTTGSITPSRTAGNLYTLDAAGRPLVRCTIRGEGGIAVSGTGTATDPFVIKANVEVAPVYISSANNAIKITGQGTARNPFTVEHKEGYQATANGLVFDRFGHLVGTAESSANNPILAIVNGIGIEVKSERQIATVSLAKPARNKSGTYMLGGYELSLDEYNRIFDLTRQIQIRNGVYALGAFDVALTDTGSISQIAASDNGLGSSFILHWPAGQDVKRRAATFTLRYATALGGVIGAGYNKDIIVTIDSVKPTIQDNYFWSYGIFQPGQHRITFDSKTGWGAAVSLLVKLSSISQPDELSEA